jgi:endogenous inhibitor of DNA gyrase (YacG/DUF329 family)
MARKHVLGLRCPTCKKLALRSDPEFPFCSGRCRVIDLGKWASGAYKVRGPAVDPEQPEPTGPIQPRDDDADGGAHGQRSHRKPH